MDSKIIKILIVGLTAVLALTIFTKKDFLKNKYEGHCNTKDVLIN